MHCIALHCIELRYIALSAELTLSFIFFLYIYLSVFVWGRFYSWRFMCKIPMKSFYMLSFCHCTNHSTILQSPSFTPSVFVVFVMRLDMYHFLTSHHSVPSGPKLFSQTETSKPNITNEMMGPSANGTKTSHCACLQLIHGINTTAATGHPIHARFQIPVIPPRTDTYPVRRRHREVV